MLHAVSICFYSKSTTMSGYPPSLWVSKFEMLLSAHRLCVLQQALLDINDRKHSFLSTKALLPPLNLNLFLATPLPACANKLSLTQNLELVFFSVVLSASHPAPVPDLIYILTARLLGYMVQRQDLYRQIRILRQLVDAFSRRPDRSVVYRYSMNALLQRITTWLSTHQF
jgi:hypothetical protein